ncbi:MAG: hypothetical protein ABIP75_14990 [Pyrinomonadaceae bacterium]
MLFVESKTSLQPVDSATRILLLDNLESKGLSPLIRRMRLDCYQQALMSQDGDLVMSHLDEMEQEIAAWCEAEEGSQYVRGELFCHDDYVLFLLFVNADDDPIGVRAGIVYNHKSVEPMRQLENFCREVRDSLKDARAKSNQGDKNAMDFTEWRLNEQKVPASFKRFETQQDLEFLNSSERRDAANERLRAAALMEDPEVRQSLRRLREANEEGHAAQIAAGGDSESVLGASVVKLTEAALIRREIVLSCRNSNLPLFRLPSPETLAAITSSGATCSVCSRMLSDEKIDELLVPTEMANKLLDEGAWLINHMQTILSAAGLPESQVAVGQSPGEGEAHMMANVNGQPFLFVLRDGDTNAAEARRALDAAVETEATHLIVMCTGKVHEDARQRLREQARRRVRGTGLAIIIMEGVDAPLDELQMAFDQVAQSALSEELFELDSSLGFNAGILVNTRFRLLQKGEGAYNRLRQVGAMVEV